MPLKNLTKAEIIAALRRLSELAAAEGVRLEATLYGGAVMLLAYDARDVTKDVDAIIHPPQIARRLVARVAKELGLAEEWLNDDVKQFVSTQEAKNELPLPNVSRDGLHLTRPTAKYLLAMKVMASRKPLPGYAGDYGDIETLLHITKIKTLPAIQKAVDSFFPDTVLPETTELALTEILEKIRRDQNSPLRLSRPLTARAVARRASSLKEFGMNLRDWFHELRRLSTRRQLNGRGEGAPAPTRRSIPQGDVADAFLAAQVELLCRRAKVPPPTWTRDPAYVLPEPWFSVPGAKLRSHLLLDTPDEFRNRNLFTTPEAEVIIRRGRPRVSDATKREKARLRQKRFRQRRAAEAATVAARTSRSHSR